MPEKASLPKSLALAPERKRQLALFQKRAGCRFRNLAILDLAFRHRSFSNEAKGEAGHARVNNERLEFLGDAVLGLVAASRLYSTRPESAEGDLAKIKSAVVSEASLAEIAAELSVPDMLILGKGEELSGGRAKKAILADAVEAVIGALFVDSGFKAAERFVIKIIDQRIALIAQSGSWRDYKSILQEYVQKNYKAMPVYKEVGRTGPAHNQVFLISVSVRGKVYGPASGKNKKAAEQSAAEKACIEMGIG